MMRVTSWRTAGVRELRSNLIEREPWRIMARLPTTPGPGRRGTRAGFGPVLSDFLGYEGGVTGKTNASACRQAPSGVELVLDPIDDVKATRARVGAIVELS
jgi:hypothetical protein